MSILLANKVLRAAEQKIENSLTPENRNNYMKIVVAGMRVGLDKGKDGILASLTKSKDPIHDAAVGAINLCLLLSRQSRGTMPLKAMVPAAMTLMLHALDFIDQAKIVSIDKAALSKGARIFASVLFKKLNITPQMLQTAAQKTNSILSDPAQLERLNRAAGVVKDPGASTPTLSDQMPAEGGDNAV